MDASQLNYCTELSSLFNEILKDLKSGCTLWDDLITKGGKLFNALKAMIYASSSFLDSFQRIADLAIKTSGGSKEIGTSLIRLCMRQKRIESTVKTISSQLITCMVSPLTAKMDQWKRALALIEKQHSRDIKRTRMELKRSVTEANRLQRKLAKRGDHKTSLGYSGVIATDASSTPASCTPTNSLSSTLGCGIGRSSLSLQMEAVLREVKERVKKVEEVERAAVYQLMLEDRARFCFFIDCLKPIMESQIGMLNEISTLRELVIALSSAGDDPKRLLNEAESALSRASGCETSFMTSNQSALSRASGCETSFMTSNQSAFPFSEQTANKADAFTAALAAVLAKRRQQQLTESANLLLTDGHDCLSLTSTESNCPTSSRHMHFRSASQRFERDEDCSPSTNGESLNGLLGSRKSSFASVNSANSYSSGLHSTSSPAHLIAEIFQQTQREAMRSASASRTNADGGGSGLEKVVLRRPNFRCHTNVAPTRAPGILSSGASNSHLETVSTPRDRASTTGDGEGVDAFSDTLNRDSTDTLQRNSLEAPALARTKLTSESEDPDEDETEGDTDGDVTGESEGDATMDSGCLDKTIIDQRDTGRAISVLYPNQAIPPPAYTNLTELTHAAQKKYSMTMPPCWSGPTNSACHYADSRALMDLRCQTTGITCLHSKQSPVGPQGLREDVLETPHQCCTSDTSNSPPRKGSDATAVITSALPNSSGLLHSTSSEDPFSLEMDELDHMAGYSTGGLAHMFGSIAACAGNKSRTLDRACTHESSYSPSVSRAYSRAPLLPGGPVQYHSGVPVGIHTLTIGRTHSTDQSIKTQPRKYANHLPPSIMKRSILSREPTLEAPLSVDPLQRHARASSLGRVVFLPDGVTAMNGAPPRTFYVSSRQNTDCTPTAAKTADVAPSNLAETPSTLQIGDYLADSRPGAAATVACSAAALLTQLSGQLQQLAHPVRASSIYASDGLDLPAPPSPDMFDTSHQPS